MVTRAAAPVIFLAGALHSHCVIRQLISLDTNAHGLQIFCLAKSGLLKKYREFAVAIPEFSQAIEATRLRQGPDSQSFCRELVLSAPALL